jgi:hypothetical protein
MSGELYRQRAAGSALASVDGAGFPGELIVRGGVGMAVQGVVLCRVVAVEVGVVVRRQLGAERADAVGVLVRVRARDLSVDLVFLHSPILDHRAVGRGAGQAWGVMDARYL